jgi:hypothetical protein
MQRKRKAKGRRMEGEEKENKCNAQATRKWKVPGWEGTIGAPHGMAPYPEKLTVGWVLNHIRATD